MNKRIRKKRRIGEFREDCFDLQFRIDASISLQDVDKLTDNFIAMIEQNQLQFGGGGQYDWSGVVQGPWRGSVTQEDREAVLD
ncbi:50S ribosome-binding protein YggL [Allorhodopirellula heiligendammensis]|nr:50S ribosome-binding protein YggL [Allorhodopirellula heiligendammensis]